MRIDLVSAAAENRIVSTRTGDYAPDSDLAYCRIRRTFAAGDVLVLDKPYRRAHLPLVNPAHPDVIAAAPNAGYHLGRYLEPRRSLVLPVAAEALESSRVFRALDGSVRNSSFAGKIAWAVMAQRRDRLHATLSAGLSAADVAPVVEKASIRFRTLGPMKVRIGGPLIGNKNTERVYFPVYPETRGGENSFHLIQDSVAKPRTDLYLMGYYNFTDHLNAEEVLSLKEILAGFAGRTILELTDPRLWLLETNDDLSLSARVVATIGG